MNIPILGTLSDRTVPADFRRFAELAERFSQEREAGRVRWPAGVPEGFIEAVLAAAIDAAVDDRLDVAG